MKATKYIMMTLLGGLTLFSSCDSMEDTYKDYLEDGEIVYRAKAKELVGASGFNRVKLTWQLEYPTQVVRCEVREDDKVLATLPVEYSDMVKMECIIKDLDERSHTFSIYTFDVQGNSSVRSDVIIEVYGARYESTLRTQRSIEEVVRKVGEPYSAMVILASNASTKLLGTDLIYKSVSGESKTIPVAPTQNVIEIANAASDSDFKLQDTFKPTESAIDEFKAPERIYEVNNLPIGSARSFTNAYTLEGKTYISLSTAASSVLRSVISYSDKELTVQQRDKTVTLDNVPEGALLEMVTYIKKGEANTEYVTMKQTFDTTPLLNLRKVATTNWTVKGFSSSQATEGNVSWTFDGNLGTFWHTEYSPNQPVYPHYIMIDMAVSHAVKGVAVARRGGNTAIASKMKLEVSTDGEAWTSVGEFSPNNAIDGLQTFQLSNPTEGRYFKLTGLASSTSATYMCISEINIYE